MAAFVTTHRLRFNDTDALGHVNNAVFATMCEQGRSELAMAAGLPIQGGADQSIVIVRLEMDFVKEMRWPGDVRIETGLLRVGGRSFTFGQRLIWNELVCCRAQTVLVVLDRASGRAAPVDPWREVLERYRLDEGG